MPFLGLLDDLREVFAKWLSLTHCYYHYNAAIMGAMASQITSPTIVYLTVCSDEDQRKHQRSASLAFVRVIHRWPGNSPHKWPVTRKMFPFDDVIMTSLILVPRQHHPYFADGIIVLYVWVSGTLFDGIVKYVYIDQENVSPVWWWPGRGKI